MAIGAISIATDLAYGRIFNWITLPALFAGQIYGAIHGGAPGFALSFIGAFCALALFGWIFFLGFMGGGDVKLLMALGAWGGPRFATETAVLSVFIGGAMAAVLLLYKGRFGDFSRRMWRFTLTLAVKELEIEKPEIDRKLTLPFGIPIAIASIWIAWESPFAEWGVRVWPF